MNREQRRKAGISKETNDRLEALKSNCTVMEAVQLAQGVSEDAIKNYHERINPIIVSLSLQIELLKEILVENNVLNIDDYAERFNKKVDDFNKEKEEAFKKFEEEISKNAEESHPTEVKTDVVPFPVQVDIRD